MARIAGSDVPDNKQVRIGLTYIFGIGDTRAAKILAEANVDPTTEVGALAEDQLNRIRQVIEKGGQIEGDLRKEISLNIKRLVEIQSYRGFKRGFAETFGGVGDVMKSRLPDGQTLKGARRPTRRRTVKELSSAYLDPSRSRRSTKVAPRPR